MSRLWRFLASVLDGEDTRALLQFTVLVLALAGAVILLAAALGLAVAVFQGASSF